MAIDMDESEGRPSRWNTLRALRVLDWYKDSSNFKINRGLTADV